MQRLDVCNQLQHLIFTYLSLKRRHDRTKAHHELRLRIRDRLANVAFIDSYSLSALYLLFFPENANQVRAAPAFTIRTVTRRTTKRLIQPLAGGSGRRAAGIAA